MTYISQIAGSGINGYFADSSGTPRLLILDMCWGLPCNAGRWSGSGGGTWDQDMDTYFSARASQGYTAWWGVPWINSTIDSSVVHTDGRTWDGIYPLSLNGTPGTISTGSETVTLNNSFWVRTDYLISTALSYGIAVFLNLGMKYDFNSGNIFGNLSSTQANAIGTAVATRYPQSSYPNLHWAFGDDTQAGAGGANVTCDTAFTQMMTGIRSTGDTRSIRIMEQYGETDCHVEFDTGGIYDSGGFGVSGSPAYITANFCYGYSQTYLGVERSYTATTAPLIPVVWGDGNWYGDSDDGSVDYTERRMVWWALSSGARGITATQGPSDQASGGDVWTWDPGTAIADLTSNPVGPFCTATIGAIKTYFTGLRDWHKLIPDTGSVFVTAGRGTRGSYQSPGFTPVYGDTDDYVTASITPAGSLAVIYCGQHYSITIDQAKMAAGYTATWVDPSSLATSTATAGSTYNSTGKGNNSAGNPDWVLVLQGPVPGSGTGPPLYGFRS